MKKIYACLIGHWVCLNEDPQCSIGSNQDSPADWWENGADVWYPAKIKEENSLYQAPYVNIQYKGKNYRINPMFIQVVTE